MLSLFPSLFAYSVLTLGVLRLIIAIVFIMEGYKSFSRKTAAGAFRTKFLSIIEVVGGIFLLVGFLTQATAIILGAISLKNTYLESRKGVGEQKLTAFYFLLCIISLSFLFLGPGLWSIDYPL